MPSGAELKALANRVGQNQRAPSGAELKALALGQREEVGAVRSLITGAGRTEFEDLPEFDVPASVAFTQPLDTAKAAFGLMTSFDPQRQVGVLKDSYPKLEFSEDRHGNIIVDGGAYGWGRGYLNKPGASMRDAFQAGGQAVAFTPAARVAKGVTFLGRALKGGAAAAGTQVGLDIGSQAAGGTEDVSIANIDPLDVGIAAGGFGLVEGLATVIRRLGPQLERAGRVTESIRNQFREAAREVGLKPDAVTDELIRSWVTAAKDAGSTRRLSMEAAQQTDEFGIPYTRGQALPEGRAKVRQMAREDTLRESAVSPRAADTLQRFKRTQEQAIGEASQRLQGSLGGQPIQRPNQAAAAVREGVQGRAAVADEAIGEAYEQVGEASLSVDGLKGLTRRIVSAPRRHGFILDATLAPATAKVLQRTRQLNRTLAKAGDRIKPVTIGKLEEQRRVLNRMIDTAANATDRRQVTIMKREFDGYLDEAMDNALFSGDDQAIEALKDARGLKSDYMRQFARQDIRTKTGRAVKDTAGDYMERIVSADPTDEEIANWLFGAAKIGAKRGSAEFAKRLKGTLGPDSEEWQQIRQAAFLKLTEPTREGAISGRMFARRLNEATQGTGETFMKELFTPTEIAAMRRFASAVQRAQPDIQNPSRTAYKAAGMVSDMGGQILRMLGWAQGPVGGVAAEVAVRGSGSVRGLRQTAQARKAVKGIARPLSPSGSGAAARGAGTAGFLGGVNEALGQ